MGVPSWLSGFVCAYYPATPGSSPKYAIYAFIISCKFLLYFSCEKNENKHKEAGFGPFLKKSVDENELLYLGNNG